MSRNCFRLRLTFGNFLSGNVSNDAANNRDRVKLGLQSGHLTVRIDAECGSGAGHIAAVEEDRFVHPEGVISPGPDGCGTLCGNSAGMDTAIHRHFEHGTIG